MIKQHLPSSRILFSREIRTLIAQPNTEFIFRDLVSMICYIQSMLMIFPTLKTNSKLESMFIVSTTNKEDPDIPISFQAKITSALYISYIGRSIIRWLPTFRLSWEISQKTHIENSFATDVLGRACRKKPSPTTNLSVFGPIGAIKFISYQKRIHHRYSSKI